MAWSREVALPLPAGRQADILDVTTFGAVAAPSIDERVARVEAGTWPAISLVVPAWNEQSRIGPTLERILADAPRLGIDEVIVVNDGSTDSTSALVRSHAATLDGKLRVMLIDHAQNRGKGAALRSGLQAATSPLVAYLDADLSIGPAPLAEARRMIDSGADVVVGRRVSDGDMADRAGQPPLRHVLSILFKKVQRAIVGLAVRDTQCPFKLFRREAVLRAVPACRSDGWAFDVEVLLLASREGYQIQELPVPWKFIGGSTVRTDPRTAWRTLRELVVIQRRHGRA